MCARKKYDPLKGSAPKKNFQRIERWDAAPTETPRPSRIFIVLLLGAIVIPLIALVVESTILQPPVVGKVVSKDSPLSYYNPGYAVISIRESSGPGNSTTNNPAMNPTTGSVRQVFIPDTLYDSLIINQEYSFKCTTNLERQTFCSGIVNGNGILSGLNLPAVSKTNATNAGSGG